LRRRWSLSGREGLGSSLPPAKLARWDSGVFEELKRLFSTTPEVGNQTEANGGHRSDRTLDRTRSLFDRTRPVSVQRVRVFQLFDRTRGASGHSRSDASGRSGCLLDSHRTLVLWCPVSSSTRPVTVSLERCSDLTSASGPSRDQHVRSSPARPVVATSASGRCFAKIAVV
jgi:hypothetical protein